MVINFDYYNENKDKQISNIEKEIIENYFINNKNENYEEILQKDNRLETFYAISNIRENLLNWYDFKKDCSILEIESNFGELTGLLCRNSNRVIATEESKEKAEAISKRYENYDNLNLYVGKVSDINLNEKFDYVVLYNPNLISYAKKYLNENGTILLAINNRFGISYFAGCSHNGRIYDTIENNHSDLFSKNEVIDLLNKNDLSNYKFYYPIPNYKIPNAIFSDDYMPHENTTKLMYNIIYENGSVVVFDELKVLKQLTKNGLFDKFTNSYLIEIKLNNEEEKNSATFVSFNNNRKKEYQLVTIIYKNKVEKKLINDYAKNHLKNIELNTKKLSDLGFNMIDKVECNKVISQYMNADTLDKILSKMFLNKKFDVAIELINNWYNYIKSRLIKNKKSKINENIEADEEEIKGLTILKNGYLDLVFENTFLKDNEFLFFDQEWYLDGIPLEYLLYRAINNLYVYNKEIENLYKMNDLLNLFNLTKYIPLFKRIENYFQSLIINDNMAKFNKESLNKLQDINKIGIIYRELSDLKENDRKQNEYIKSIEQDNKNKQEYILALENQIKILNEEKNKRFFFKRR